MSLVAENLLTGVRSPIGGLCILLVSAGKTGLERTLSDSERLKENQKDCIKAKSKVKRLFTQVRRSYIISVPALGLMLSLPTSPSSRGRILRGYLLLGVLYYSQKQYSDTRCMTTKVPTVINHHDLPADWNTFSG